MKKRRYKKKLLVILSVLFTAILIIFIACGIIEYTYVFKFIYFIGLIIFLIGTIMAVQTYFFKFKTDYNIYKNGEKYNGICLKSTHFGRTTYLYVEWYKDNKKYSNEYQALPKIKSYPYDVIVYLYDNKSNLGIYSLVYDIFWGLIILIFSLVTLFLCINI